MNEKYPLALPEGSVLAGQYIIEGVLGQGGFGITYEARDHKTGDRVAVKEFFPDSMATRTNQTTVSAFSGERGESFAYGKSCFLQEAETLARFIGNENIVRIHSYFEENGTAYFVMDFIEGTSFDEYLRERGGKIPFDEAAQILIPVMDALSVVHSQGIIHRDVTPDNIYITKEGVVKLLDFGAARYSLGDKSRSLDIILKHGFAPKEQYTRRGKQGPYTDVYALGATFYFALTGKRPPDSVERIDEDDLVPPSSLGVQISDAAEDAILQALNLQPADRFQSMPAFKNAMLNVQQSAAAQPVLATAGAAVTQTYFNDPAQSGIPRTEPMGAPPASGPDQGAAFQAPAGGTPAKPAAGKKRLPLIAGGVVAALLVVVVALGALGRNTDTAPDPDPTDAPGEETTEPATSNSLDDLINGSLDEPLDVPLGDPTDETQPEETAPTESAPSATPTGNLSVISNSAGNIMNSGLIVTDDDGNAYWINDSGHAVYSELEGDYIFESEDEYYQNLVIGDGKLFIWGEADGENAVLAYNPETQDLEEVPFVSADYYSQIARLFLTQDYYVIGRQNADDTVTVCLVSRSDGQTFECCTVQNEDMFTISNDGWLYYIDDSMVIHRMNMYTLTEEEGLAHSNSPEETKFTIPMVAGEYLYFFVYFESDRTAYYFYRIDRNTPTDLEYWNISSEVGLELSSPGLVWININETNQDIFFGMVDEGTSLSYLFQIKVNADGTFTADKFSENSYAPNILYYPDGSYELNYFSWNSERECYRLYYRKYDADGNYIKD